MKKKILVILLVIILSVTGIKIFAERPTYEFTNMYLTKNLANETVLTGLILSNAKLKSSVIFAVYYYDYQKHMCGYYYGMAYEVKPGENKRFYLTGSGDIDKACSYKVIISAVVF